ncbi:MAG: alpha/beta hydrolase, partial [Alphaproteobacteria bacterium]
LSSGTRGHIENFESVVKDLFFLVDNSQKNSDENEKWIILGHGLGGLVTLDLINRYQELIENKIDGLVLSNFILKFSSIVLQIENQVTSISMGIKNLMAHLRFVRLLKGSEMLSRPRDILQFDQDPLLVHRPTLVTFKEIQNKVANIYQDSYFLGKPILLLKSDRDNAINSNGIDYFAKGIKKELLTEKNYSLMKHDLYNETDREIVFQDIMDWMKMYEN